MIGNRSHLLWISTINQFPSYTSQNASHWGNLAAAVNCMAESSVNAWWNSLILQTLSPNCLPDFEAKTLINLYEPDWLYGSAYYLLLSSLCHNFICKCRRGRTSGSGEPLGS